MVHLESGHKKIPSRRSLVQITSVFLNSIVTKKKEKCQRFEQLKLKVTFPCPESRLFRAETRATAHAYAASPGLARSACFFILTVSPTKIEMKKHALHASPGDAA